MKTNPHKPDGVSEGLQGALPAFIGAVKLHSNLSQQQRQSQQQHTHFGAMFRVVISLSSSHDTATLRGTFMKPFQKLSRDPKVLKPQKAKPKSK